MGQQPTDDIDFEVPEAAEEYREQADALDDLAERLRNADSIAGEVPELSKLFHEVRTSKRRARDGRHVALFDYDAESGFECRSVAFLEGGTNYRDTGADLSLSFNPWPFISVSEFAEYMAGEISRDAQAARQNAQNVEMSARDKARMEQAEGY